MIEENAEIVARRWPELQAWFDEAPRVEVDVAEGPESALIVDGIQLAGAFAPAEEAVLQARLVPADATTATVYGLGHGNVPRLLLRNQSLERLRIVLMSRAASKASLAFVELFDWLDDPRVELVRATAEMSLEVPFAVAPAALRLADPDAWRLRDTVSSELAAPFLRKRMEAKDEQLTASIEANRAFVTSDPSVSALFDTKPGATVRVAAAGPTLSDHYDLLARGDHTLIAVDASLKPLLEAGIVPDVVVSIDALRVSMVRIFDVPHEQLGACALVYFPVVPNEILSGWPGPRYAALGEAARYDALRSVAENAELWSNGSVIHPAVDLAVQMGAGRVELFGADFATPNGNSHVDGMSEKKTEVVDPSRPHVLNGYSQPVPSMSNLLSYLRDFERYVERSRAIDFINMSRDGAHIRGVRYADEEHAA